MLQVCQAGKQLSVRPWRIPALVRLRNPNRRDTASYPELPGGVRGESETVSSAEDRQMGVKIIFLIVVYVVR